MAAPEGNQYWQLRNSFGKKKFQTVEELEEKIDAYFERCDDNTKMFVTDKGIHVTKSAPIPYTVEGLANVLGCDRETLLNYEKEAGYEAYFGTIKEAKAKIAQNKLERGLMGESNPAVTIFDLKNNHGYRDQSNVDLTTKGESLNPADDYENWVNSIKPDAE